MLALSISVRDIRVLNAAVQVLWSAAAIFSPVQSDLLLPCKQKGPAGRIRAFVRAYFNQCVCVRDISLRSTLRKR